MKPTDDIELIRSLYDGDAFARQLGIQLDELGDDYVCMHMNVTEQMLNLYGMPHGAAIYALADAAFSVLANNRNNISVALDCTITYHNRPSIGRDLYVKGSTLAVSKRIGSYLFDVYAEDNGRRVPVATMKGTAFRTGRPAREP
jgi:acyl-CoA thioesterase